MNKRNFAIVATLLLAGCGGNGGGEATLPPPVTTGDAFTNAVRGVIASSPDNIEPAAIDSFTVTAPDNTESEAL